MQMVSAACGCAALDYPAELDSSACKYAAGTAKLTECVAERDALKRMLTAIRGWDFLNPPPSGADDWRTWFKPEIDKLLAPAAATQQAEPDCACGHPFTDHYAACVWDCYHTEDGTTFCACREYAAAPQLGKEK